MFVTVFSFSTPSTNEGTLKQYFPVHSGILLYYDSLFKCCSAASAIILSACLPFSQIGRCSSLSGLCARGPLEDRTNHAMHNHATCSYMQHCQSQKCPDKATITTLKGAAFESEMCRTSKTLLLRCQADVVFGTNFFITP